MASLRYLCILKFLLFSFVIVIECNVPVLLWESRSISEKEDVVPAMYQLDSDEFNNLMVKKVHSYKPLVVVFLEESLSMEDFSWKDDHGQGSFPQLQNITSMSAKTEFITSVDSPMSALRDLCESQGYSWNKFDSGRLPKDTASVLEVSLEGPSGDEDRPDLLRKHDNSVANIYSQLLSKYSNILAIFTGKYTSWVEPEYNVNRIRREATDEEFKVIKMAEIKSGNITVGIRSSTFPVLKLNSNDTELTINPNEAVIDSRKNEVALYIYYKNLVNAKEKLKFKFTLSEDKWVLSDVSVTPSDNIEISLTPSKPISNKLGQSVLIKEPVSFTNQATGTSLKFTDIQVPVTKIAVRFTRNVKPEMQPWMATQELVDAPEEYSYFTIPILTGLFITAILLLILTLGLVMILDIRTMDRFDDPKGKTITVPQAD